MHPYYGAITVIHPRPSELGILQGESEWLNQMKGRAGVGRQAHAVARVGWDLGAVEDDLEQLGLTGQQPQRDRLGED